MADPYYEDEYVTLYHGDCREVLTGLSGDTVVADPPYGVEVAEWDRAPVQSDLDMCLSAVDGPVVWFGAAPPRCQASLFDLTPIPERTYIWHNTFTLTHSEGAFYQWQPIYVWRKQAFTGMGKDVVSVTSTGQGRLHPTQKPLDLMQRVVGCTEGVLIDPFMGSGTTLLAAKNLSRRAIGVEREEHYCEVAAERLSQQVLAL